MRTSLDYVETVLPKDHLCRLVKEVVFSLDTEPIETKYSFLGQHTYHPKYLLSLLFYGYATGVRSSRKLAERCISDHTYIYLMQSYTPDHRTISDFRKNNLKEIEKYFVDIVRIFSKLGYSHAGKIYIDGTKLKGNASAKRTKDRAGFEKWLSETEEEIGKLLKECETIDNQEDLSSPSPLPSRSLTLLLSASSNICGPITSSLIPLLQVLFYSSHLLDCLWFRIPLIICLFPLLSQITISQIQPYLSSASPRHYL